MATDPSLQSIEAKLETLVKCMEQMNRRDRPRTAGGFVRSIITLVPVFIVIWGSWYFSQHADELMNKVIEQSASAAAKNSQATLDQLKQKYNIRIQE